MNFFKRIFSKPTKAENHVQLPQNDSKPTKTENYVQSPQDDTVKKCAICGAHVRCGEIECPKCGSGRFAPYKASHGESSISRLARKLLSVDQAERNEAINATRNYSKLGITDGLSALEQAIRSKYSGTDTVSFRQLQQFVSIKPGEAERSYKMLIDLANRKMLWKTNPGYVQELYVRATGLLYDGIQILREIEKTNDDDQILAFQLIGQHYIVARQLSAVRNEEV